MRAYTHGGWAHRWVSTTFSTRKNSHTFFLCSGGSVDLVSDALPPEPPPHSYWQTLQESKLKQTNKLSIFIVCIVQLRSCGIVSQGALFGGEDSCLFCLQLVQPPSSNIGEGFMLVLLATCATPSWLPLTDSSVLMPDFSPSLSSQSHPHLQCSQHTRTSNMHCNLHHKKGINKLVKPCKCFQSQGHVKIKKAYHCSKFK